MTKHVVIISGVFLPEPIVSATILSDLALDLSKKYKVTILRPHPTRPLGFDFPKFDISLLPYEIVEIQSYTCPKSSIFGRFYESISMGRACTKYIDENKKNIDFIYNAPWHLFGRYFVARKAKKCNIPYVTPVQDIYPESILSKIPKYGIIKYLVNKLLIPVDRYVLSNATLIHTISDKLKIYLSKTRNIEGNKFIVVPNWQNEEPFIKFTNVDNTQNSSLIFMFLGNVGALAGLDIVIKAFVKANIRQSELIIAGSGSEKNNLKKSVQLISNTNITFIDVPYGKVAEIQAIADVLILPVKKSFYRTSIPSKFLAYMFSSKPILASVDSDSDTAYYVNEAECGWVIDPENIGALVAKFHDIAKLDKGKLNLMGRNGFEYAINHFSRTKNLFKLSNACEKVINNK
jgi:glycosyltransferase involved in cell wall biosynthesis